MNRYEKKIFRKANRMIYDCELTITEYKIVIDFIEGEYTKTKEGFIRYLKFIYYNNCYITINEYYNLYSIA